MKNPLKSQQVTLRFPDLCQLWSFSQTLGSRILHINTKMNSIICRATKVDIARAILKYHGTLHTDQHPALAL